MVNFPDPEKIFGMIGAADKGTACDLRKPHIQCNLFPIFELFGGHITLHFEVKGGRLEVLAKGKHLAACMEKVLKSTADFRGGFPKSQHKARLYCNCRSLFFCPLQKSKRALIGSLGPYKSVETGDGFDIVV